MNTKEGGGARKQVFCQNVEQLEKIQNDRPLLSQEINQEKETRVRMEQARNMSTTIFLLPS